MKWPEGKCDIEAMLTGLQAQARAGNAWLDRKINHDRRLKEHEEYMRKWFPRLFWEDKLDFLDIGCGPGESLEVARSWNHYGTGIETPIGAGGMGDDYVAYGIRRHILQKLNVLYGPALDVIKALPADRYDCVNMRGSFEQIFSSVMDGVPHDHHHKASLMTWNMPKAVGLLDGFARDIRRIMQRDGNLVIHANGSVNHEEMKPVMQEIFGRNRFSGEWIEDHVYEGIAH